MPGEARAYAEGARERFGRLELYPMVLRLYAHNADSYRAAMAAARELALRSPERLTAGHWELLRAKVDLGPVPATCRTRAPGSGRRSRPARCWTWARGSGPCLPSERSERRTSGSSASSPRTT